jgi:hypothetical protein
MKYKIITPHGYYSNAEESAVRQCLDDAIRNDEEHYARRFLGILVGIEGLKSDEALDSVTASDGTVIERVTT